MNLKNSRHLILLVFGMVTVLIIPSIALAAWWNPFDWWSTLAAKHGEAPAGELSATSTIPDAGETDRTIAALKTQNAQLREQVTKLLEATSQCKLTAAQSAVVKTAATVISTPTPAPEPNQSQIDATNAKALRIEIARTEKLDIDFDALYARYTTSLVTTGADEDSAPLLDLLNTTKDRNGNALFNKNDFKNLVFKGVWLRSDLTTALPNFVHQKVAAYRADLKIQLSQYPASESSATY